MLITEDLIELIGIILGDGGIIYDENSHHYKFTITLNGIDEEEYVKYVENLNELVFGIIPSKSWERDKPSANYDSKAISLKVYSKSIIKKLLNIGLISGNKIINQIKAPNIVFSKKEYSLRCLKGLIDTDGSIYVYKSRATIYISFSSASKPLAKDFQKLAKYLNITSNLYGPYSKINPETGRETLEYIVKIIKKEDVKKCLSMINPEKWKDQSRRMYLGMILIGLKDRAKFKKVIQEIMETYKINRFTYSKENADILKQMCLKYGYEINDALIEQAIEESFEFKYLIYSRETAEYMKDLAIQLSSFKAVTRHLNKKYKKTAISFVSRLFQEEDYVNKYGNDAFEKWAQSNFELLINKKQRKMQRFSFEIKAMLCQEILELGKSNRKNNIQMEANEIIPLLTEMINLKDLNGELITDEDIYYEENVSSEETLRVLKYERLNYLLNDPNYCNMAKKYLNKLIVFLNEINKFRNLKRKFNLDKLRKHFRNNCNIHWRAENLKKLLIRLNFYKDLITEEEKKSNQIKSESREKYVNEGKANNTAHFEKGIRERKKTGVKSKINQIRSLENTPKQKDLKKKNNEINVHNPNFRLKIFPYIYPRKEGREIDFTDIYTWISPQMREQMREKARSLQQEVREDINYKGDFPVRNKDEIKIKSNSMKFEPFYSDLDKFQAKKSISKQYITKFDDIQTESNVNRETDMEPSELYTVNNTPKEEFDESNNQEQSIDDDREEEINPELEMDSSKDLTKENISEGDEYSELGEDNEEEESPSEEDVGSDFGGYDAMDPNPSFSEQDGNIQDSESSQTQTSQTTQQTSDNNPEDNPENNSEQVTEEISEKGIESASDEANEDMPESLTDDINDHDELQDSNSSEEKDQLSENVEDSNIQDEIEKDDNNKLPNSDQEFDDVDEISNELDDNHEVDIDKDQKDDVNSEEPDLNEEGHNPDEPNLGDDEVNNLVEQNQDNDEEDNMNDNREDTPESDEDIEEQSTDPYNVYDVYDPVNFIDHTEINPDIASFHSSNLGGYRNGLEDKILDNFEDKFDEKEEINSFDDILEENPIKKDDMKDEIKDDQDEYILDDGVNY